MIASLLIVLRINDIQIIPNMNSNIGQLGFLYSSKFFAFSNILVSSRLLVATGSNAFV
jgi:hypothetical protein